MGMTDRIEAFITELLKDDTDDWLEIKRNELASVFGCVPSQINYVISTRFTPENGYMVESRRGGGGCLKIRRIRYSNGIVGHTIEMTGDSLDEKTARSLLANLVRQEVIDQKTAAVIMSAVSDAAVNAAGSEKDALRADIMKNILKNLG